MTAPQRECRLCQAPLTHTFVDLGMSPLANSYLKPEQLQTMEAFYPLHVYVCGSCFLVQLEQFETPENIFADYAYFSSYSESMLRHASEYTDDVVQRFGINTSSLVVEVGSNDGYLLQYFKQKGVPVLGVEPAENVARVAREAGIESVVSFFGLSVARDLETQGCQADLLVANNVLAHVPDLNGFVAGMKVLLKPRGVITVEFPHLSRLIQGNQFDTIYHEHVCYFSLISVEQVFEKHGLTVFDVEEVATHGGSLRIFVRHHRDESKTVTPRVAGIKRRESQAELDRLEGYAHFSECVMETKRRLLEILIGVKQLGKTIVGYGAAAKAATLLNYCGIRTDFIDYVVDRNPHKQGLFLPGTHIPILSPDIIPETQPDYVLILPWNLKEEICRSMAVIRQWGGQFIVPIPVAEVIT